MAKKFSELFTDYTWGYLKEQWQHLQKNVRTYLILSFAEEHLGDRYFYKTLVNEGVGWSHFARRKLFNPFKWLQFAVSFVFACLIQSLYLILDVAFVLPAMCCGLIFHGIMKIWPSNSRKKGAEATTESPRKVTGLAAPGTPLASTRKGGGHETPRARAKGDDKAGFLEQLLKDTSKLHAFLVSLPKLFVLGNVGFLRNPIEILLSPINRVFHPFKALNGLHKFLAISALVAFIGIGVGLNLVLNFTFFSFTSILLFFPHLVQFILATAGTIFMEALAGTITCFNLSGFIVNYFEHSVDQQLEKNQLIHQEPGSDYDETSSEADAFEWVVGEIKHAAKYRWLPTVYHEKIKGRRGRYYLNDRDPHEPSLKLHHYATLKFFDLPLNVEEARSPESDEGMSLSHSFNDRDEASLPLSESVSLASSSPTDSPSAQSVGSVDELVDLGGANKVVLS